MDSVEKALKDFEEATSKLRRAYRPFDDNKHQDPNDVNVATAALRISVDEAKARLDASLSVARDRSASRTTCVMVVLTCAITLATAVQACVGYLNYKVAKTARPVVCAETRN